MGGLDGGAGDENRGREDGRGLHFGGLCWWGLEWRVG